MAQVDAPTPAERLALLEARARRERAARLEAERIAEDGLRALWEANRFLDRRVAERTVELEEARSAALGAAQAKTEFLATLSHEVGTPLQTILAAVELAEPGDDTDRQRLDQAADAARRLDQLFRNLLELAECEVGTVVARPSPTDMRDVAERLERRWASRLAAAGLLLSPDAAGHGDLDADRLVRIGDLLLDNALRHAEPGVVQLVVHATDGSVELEVADSGPGVAEEDLARIPEPFVRLDPAPSEVDASTAGSAGIGLALARGLAEALGGTADARRNDAGGLTVEVRIPVDEPLGAAS